MIGYAGPLGYIVMTHPFCCQTGQGVLDGKFAITA